MSKLGAAIKLLTGDWHNPLATLDLLAKKAEELKTQTQAVIKEVRRHMPALVNAAAKADDDGNGGAHEAEGRL